MTESTSQKFYADLESFSDFEELSKNEIYKPVPPDWFVVIVDVEGSTQAIENGRYRDVNTLGAASIAVVQKAFESEPLAFVFGGDGATFLIPPHRLEKVKGGLLRLKSFAASQFQIKLRVGLVSVAEIQAEGQKLEAAKFQLIGAKHIAFFRGGGLAWADYMVKTVPRKYCLRDQSIEALNDFEGVSCRWRPIKAKRGRILTILVQPRLMDSTLIFETVLAELKQILGGSLEQSSPIQKETMKYKSFWRTLRDEWNLAPRKLSRKFSHRVFEILLCQAAFRWRIPVPFAAKNYFRKIPAHSDYRKYDDMLRLILDCSSEQIDSIKATLSKAYTRGEIFFGTFESSHALMTCLVESVSDGGHIHLIDGSEGGYTMAAKALNEQRKGSRRANPSELMA